jgi:hypothetical protein
MKTIYVSTETNILLASHATEVHYENNTGLHSDKYFVGFKSYTGVLRTCCIILHRKEYNAFQ